MPHRYTCLALYNSWANARLYDAAAAVPDARLSRRSRRLLQIAARHVEPSPRRRSRLDAPFHRGGRGARAARRDPLRRFRGAQGGAPGRGPAHRGLCGGARRGRARGDADLSDAHQSGPDRAKALRTRSTISSTIRRIIAARRMASSPPSRAMRPPSIWSSCSAKRAGRGGSAREALDRCGAERHASPSGSARNASIRAISASKARRKSLPVSGWRMKPGSTASLPFAVFTFTQPITLSAKRSGMA